MGYGINKYGEVFNQLDAFTALRFTGTGPLLAAERMRILPITFEMKESSYLRSQITGGVENAVPLHANIPRSGGRDFDLPSEDALQEYLKFPYECFLSVLLFEGYCCKRCPSNNPRRKSLAPTSSNFSSVSTRRLCLVLLSIKNPVVLILFTKL
jgi:hypothetical protein